MKRTMIVMFALAMLLAWSGSAMAQEYPEADNNALLKAASDNCKLSVSGTATKMFPNAVDASQYQLLTMPYVTGANPDVFRTGFALINKGSLEKENIVGNSLCIVGVKADGTAVSSVYTRRIVSGAIETQVVDLMGENWDNDMILAVFQNRALPETGATPLTNLDGFYIIGDGTQAQGAFALNGIQNGTDEITFSYVPGTPFAGGVAIFNNNAEKDAKLAVSVTYSDGQPFTLTGDNAITVEKGKMVVKTFEDLFGTSFDVSKAAQIKLTNTIEPDDRPKSLFAFTFFGDGAQAYGYSSPQQ